MEENENNVVESSGIAQQKRFSKLRRLSIKNKYFHNELDCNVSHDTENIRMISESEGNEVIKIDPLIDSERSVSTEEGVPRKKLKESKITATFSPFFKCYIEQHKLNSISEDNKQSIIQDVELLDECCHNEEQKFNFAVKESIEDYDVLVSKSHSAICNNEAESTEMKCNCSESPNDASKCSKKNKHKFSAIKRRAGLLYKQIMNSKLNNVHSEYFTSNKNSTTSRWIPPRSPYALIQEDLFDKPWQLLIATIFLTKVSAKKAIPQIHKFLKRWPRPEDLLLAELEDLYEYMKPLGLTMTRSHSIMRFTVDFLEKEWKYPKELYGIGKYGDDSYRMFCINEWRQVRPDDIPLNLYRNWLLENADALGINKLYIVI